MTIYHLNHGDRRVRVVWHRKSSTLWKFQKLEGKWVPYFRQTVTPK